MSLIRVKYIKNLGGEYLTKDDEYYIDWNPDWRETHTGKLVPIVYFTSADEQRGTFINIHKVENAFEHGGLEIIEGKEKPPHIK